MHVAQLNPLKTLKDEGCIVIHTQETYVGKQGLTYFAGILPKARVRKPSACIC
jgi:uncharacterized RmlC-like cupin family protein